MISLKPDDKVKLNPEISESAIKSGLEDLIEIGTHSIRQVMGKELRVVEIQYVSGGCLICFLNIVQDKEPCTIILNDKFELYGLEMQYPMPAFVGCEIKNDIYCSCSSPSLVTASYTKDVSYFYCRKCKKERL